METYKWYHDCLPQQIFIYAQEKHFSLYCYMTSSYLIHLELLLIQNSSFLQITAALIFFSLQFNNEHWGGHLDFKNIDGKLSL